MKTGMLALGRQRLERLVVLVDVRVFALQGNPKAAKAYATLITSSVERMLAASNEHSTGYKRGTMWAYKLFDSSLSPLASRSTIQGFLDKKQLHLVRFNTAEENLATFEQALQKVSFKLNMRKSIAGQQAEGKVEFVVRALQELLSEFTWDPLFLSDGSSSDEDQARQKRGISQGGNSLRIQQNVVILFSHVPCVVEQFAGFLNVSTPQGSTTNSDLLKTFSSKIRNLLEPFRMQNIHACWIDMPRMSSPLSVESQGLSVFTGLEHRIKRHMIRSVFAEAKWGYMAMETLAIASDCIPLSMLWSSIAYPAPQVQPEDGRLRAKLQVSIQGRDAMQIQPEVCRLEAVPLGCHVGDSSLMKENVSVLLRIGALSTKVKELSSVKLSAPQSAKVKIVVKSLVPKHNLSFKGSVRYLLYLHMEDGPTGKRRNDVDSAGDQSAQDGISHANEVAHNSYGDEILQQLQQEPMIFVPGQPAWQVLLIAIARKQSVAEVDLYQDGVCSPAILEPITVNYAVLLQMDHSMTNWSSDCHENLGLQRKRLRASGPCATLGTIVEEGDDDAQEQLASSECATIKQESRPRKRSATAIAEQDGPLLKREKVAGVERSKSDLTKGINGSKREAYSWNKHWQFILHRNTVGTGKYQIENKYLRPGQGKRPSKALVTIKCWLDQLHTDREQAAEQVIPSSPMITECAEFHTEGAKTHEGSVLINSSENAGPVDNSIVPVEVYTEEQAEAYLSSIEQMVQECLTSEDGDLQVFVKSLVSNAQVAQRVLSRRDFVNQSAHALTYSTQYIAIDCGSLVFNREESTTCNQENMCEANLVCTSNRAEVKERRTGSDEVGVVTTLEMLRLENGSIPSENIGPGIGRVPGCVDAGDHAAMEVCGSVTLDNCRMKGNTNVPSEDHLEEVVAKQLVKKLLVKPKKLARQYKDCQPATLSSPDMIAEEFHTREEKLRAYELQILFRMQLIGRDTGGPLEKQKKTLVKEICQLLDDMLFHLGGGVFGGESLHDYSIRVIHNRFKGCLPQTVAAIFERMEFNGYAEAVAESHPAPESTHLEGTHHQNDTQKGELEGMDTSLGAQGSDVPPMQAPKSTSQSKGLHTSSKGNRRKRSKAPLFRDEYTRASEKRKLASRLAHFGGPESHHRLKKIRLQNQTHMPKVSSSMLAKLQPKEHDVVLETPMVSRHQAMPETPMVLEENNEVDSLFARVVMSTGRFGFGTPARVARQHQPTSRKRRLILGSHKKPPGRGLPRIALDAMKARRELQRAMHEEETLQEPSIPHAQLESEFLTQDEDAVCTDAVNVLPPSQNWTLLGSDRQGQSAVGIVKDVAPVVSSPLPEMAREEGIEHSKHDMVLENTGCTGSDTFILYPELSGSPFPSPAGGLQNNDSHSGGISATQEEVDTHAVHDFDISTFLNMNTPESGKKNRRKSVQTFNRRKEDLPNCSPDCSKSHVSASVSKTPSPASKEDCSSGLGSATRMVVDTQIIDEVENYESFSSRSSTRNRRKSPRASLYVEETPSSSLTGLPTNYDSPASAPNETRPVEQESTIARTASVLNSEQQQPLKCAKLDSPQTPAFPEVCPGRGSEAVTSLRTRRDYKESPSRIGRSLKVCCLNPSGSPLPDMLAAEGIHAEPAEGGVKSVSVDTGKRNVNRSGKMRKLHRLARQRGATNSSVAPPLSERHTEESLKGVICVHSEAAVQITHERSSPAVLKSNRKSLIFPSFPPSPPPHQSSPSQADHHEHVDLELEQVINKIVCPTHKLDGLSTEKCPQQKCLAEVSQDSDEEPPLHELFVSMDPKPRLRPEARLTSSSPRAHKRKKVGLVYRDEELPAVVTASAGKENCIPALKKKNRRASEGSPGHFAIRKQKQEPSSRRKTRSATTSPQ